MVYSKQHCSRVVHRSKYERGDPQRRDWWQTVFKALESDAALPPDYRYEVLQETLDPHLFQDIQKILPVIRDPSREVKKPVILSTSSSTSSSTEVGSQSTSTVTLQTFQHLKNAEGSLHPSKTEEPQAKPNLRLGVTCGDVGPKNPYVNFFKRPMERAAVWRPIPPPSLETMNLCQKADAVTQQIAVNFSNWMRSVSSGGAVLTPEAIIRMFDYGYKTHAATSLCVQIRELPSVPQMVADRTDFPWLSFSSALKQQVRRDKRANMKEKRCRAFETTLPQDDMVFPPKVKIQWHKKNERVKRVESLSPIWEGITNIRSTMAYSNWLLKKGDQSSVPFPEYFRKCKLDDEDFLEKCLNSAEFFDESLDDEDLSVELDEEGNVRKSSKPQEEDAISQTSTISTVNAKGIVA